MTLLTDLHGVVLVEISNLYVAIGIMAVMTTRASRRLRIARFPLGQEHMEMIIHVLFLENSIVAFQTVAILNGIFLYGRLGIMPAIERDEIGRARHQSTDAAKDAAIGVAIDTARRFGGVETRQIDRRARGERTLIKRHLAFRVTRHAETIVILKLCGCEHDCQSQRSDDGKDSGNPFPARGQGE
jgi:hypothetical protein